jgi:hypothetical protein
MHGYNGLLNCAGGAFPPEVKQDITEAGEKSGWSWNLEDFRIESESRIRVSVGVT